MLQPQKYMFDNNFDKKQTTNGPLAELKAKFDQKIESERSAAFEEGRIAGEQTAMKTIENQTKTALKNLVKQEAHLKQNYDQELRKLEAKSIEFGVTAGTRLAGELLKREPMTEIENFFREAFQIIGGVPEVTAKLHPSITDAVSEASEKWMQEEGVTSNFRFLADESLNSTDVNLTWKDGGINRSLDDLMASIHKALTNYFTAKEQNATLKEKNDPIQSPSPEQSEPVPEETQAPVTTQETELAPEQLPEEIKDQKAQITDPSLEQTDETMNQSEPQT